MVSELPVLDQLVTLSNHLGDPANDYAILGEGNTSGRLDADEFFVKASGQHLGNITADGFCRVRFDAVLPHLEGPDLDDAAVRAALLACTASGASGVLPSVETFFHAFLLTLPGVNFVGHTHPTAVNGLMCSTRARECAGGRMFPDEIVCCGPAPCFVEYTDPGIVLSRTMRDRVTAHCDAWGEPPKVILMQNHGFIALGATPRDVITTTAMAVKAARIQLAAWSVGAPAFLTAAQVARIHTRPDEHYRQRLIGGTG